MRCFPVSLCQSKLFRIGLPTALRLRNQKENHTEKTIQKKNKDLVLKAFDTLFNKRDYGGGTVLVTAIYSTQCPHSASPPRAL